MRGRARSVALGDIKISESETRFISYNPSMNQSFFLRTGVGHLKRGKNEASRGYCLRRVGEMIFFYLGEGGGRGNFFNYFRENRRIKVASWPGTGLIIPELIKIRLGRRRNKGQPSESIRPPESILTPATGYNCELIESAVKCDPSKSLDIILILYYALRQPTGT